MKIYLIRHGQTDLNKERRMQGRNGLPLNEEGVAQAMRLCEKLKNVKFDMVFSSPQERAVQTAEIATGISPTIDERLNVFDLGTADGLKVNEIKMVGGVIPDPTIYSGVESVSDYVARVYHFMLELYSKNKNNPDINVLICGHKCTTGCVSAFIEGMPKDGNFLKLSSPNGEYKVYDYPAQHLENVPAK